MGQARGFLLLDMLATMLLVCLSAALIFPLVTVCRLQAAASSRRLEAAAAAEDLITLLDLDTRSLAHPEGPPACAGEDRRVLLVGGRTFNATVTKEVVPACIGLYRWRVTVVPAGGPLPGPREGIVTFLAGCYDPF